MRIIALILLFCCWLSLATPTTGDLPPRDYHSDIDVLQTRVDGLLKLSTAQQTRIEKIESELLAIKANQQPAAKELIPKPKTPVAQPPATTPAVQAYQPIPVQSDCPGGVCLPVQAVQTQTYYYQRPTILQLRRR